MKNYIEMSRNEIQEIIKKGGDSLRDLNNSVIKHLNNLKLSEAAETIIADTPINNMAEAFGGLFTAEQVEQFIKENY